MVIGFRRLQGADTSYCSNPRYSQGFQRSLSVWAIGNKGPVGNKEGSTSVWPTLDKGGLPLVWMHWWSKRSGHERVGWRA
jgi:hypothetical protein